MEPYFGKNLLEMSFCNGRLFITLSVVASELDYNVINGRLFQSKRIKFGLREIIRDQS